MEFFMAKIRIFFILSKSGILSAFWAQWKFSGDKQKYKQV